MIALTGLIRDTLAEAIDKRGILVLAAFGLIVVVALGSLSFTVANSEELLVDRLERLNEQSLPGVRGSYRISQVAPIVQAAGEVTPELGFSAAMDDGVYGEVRFEMGSSAALLPSNWVSFLRRNDLRAEAPPEADPDSGADYFPALDRRVEWFLRDRLERYGFERVEVQAIAAIADGRHDDPAIWRVAVSAGPLEGDGPKDVQLFFGLIELESQHLSVQETVLGIQEELANTLAGFLGVLVFVSVCAGFLPSLLEKGTLDLHLARPVTRGWLFLGKYFAAVLFVLVFTAVLFTACWLALRLATGFGTPWLILCALTVTGIFAVLHAVAACLGVLSRSGSMASLGAFGVWGAASLAHSLHQYLGSSTAESWPSALRSGVEWAHRLLPRTNDLAEANRTILAKATIPEHLWEKRYEGQLAEIDWVDVIGPSALFAAVFLVLAIFFLGRRDG